MYRCEHVYAGVCRYVCMCSTCVYTYIYSGMCIGMDIYVQLCKHYAYICVNTAVLHCFYVYGYVYRYGHMYR